MLLSIDEGDRVWFSWNKDKVLFINFFKVNKFSSLKTQCAKKHAIYEIALPMPDHASTEAYFVSNFSYYFILNKEEKL